MTFVGHIAYLYPSLASFAPERSEGSNDVGIQINYVPNKIRVIILLLGYLKDSNAAAHSVDTALVRQWDLKESKMTLNVLFTCWKVLE